MALKNVAAAALILVGCDQEIEKRVYYVVSEYCNEWSNFMAAARDADAGTDADEGAGETDVSGDMALFDVEQLSDATYEPVRAPLCRSARAESDSLFWSYIGVGTSLIGQTPRVGTGHRYRLLLGFYLDDPACDPDDFLVCGVSNDITVDDDPVRVHLLCPAVDLREEGCEEPEACGFSSEHCAGGTCSDGGFEDERAPSSKADHGWCKMVHDNFIPP
ncbi:MAG: hypothetical protein HYY06_21055 [Deltaproteobacteria bacterium]|nr:hypothetical protein [Deltaproteobacteria bacterium]